MKEKDFNQSLKNAVDDFETNSEVTFNQERVWKNIKVKKRIIWFDILKVTAIVLLFICFGVWFNSSDPIQIEKKQVRKNTVSPKQNSLVDTNVEEPINQIQKSINVYVKNNSKIRNQLEIIKSENKIIEAETFEIEAPNNLISEEKTIIKAPIKTTPEIVYAIEFKRGKLLDKSATQQKEDALVISFKKYKKPLFKTETNTIMANSDTSNHIYKLKF